MLFGNTTYNMPSRFIEEIDKKYLDIDWTENFAEAYLEAIADTTYKANSGVENALAWFKQKYEKLAVTVKEENWKVLKKVPGKNIYFVKWDIDPSNITKLDKPVTIVQTEWNTTINWNVSYNMMLLTENDIIFNGDCRSNQTVKWIFYAKWNLHRNVKKNNNIKNTLWCDKWWLHVKWVLIWNNFNILMENSRSHLENWFHANDKRKEIMDWASVLIEYSPSVFTKSTMPPGAEDFTTALSIYKQ